MGILKGKEFRNILLRILAEIELSFTDMVRPVVQTENLTTFQSEILFVLDERQIVNISTLAKILNAAPSNVSVTCRHLQDKGLLCRTRHMDDERVMEVYLSEAGKELLERLNTKFSFYDRTLEKFSDERIQSALKGYDELCVLLNLLKERREGLQ